jgi:hypothetical protein
MRPDIAIKERRKTRKKTSEIQDSSGDENAQDSLPEPDYSKGG